jgi:putative membrane protein
MTFVDTLAFQLFTLAFVSGLLFYSGIVGYSTYRKYGPRRTFDHLKAQAVPLGGIGLIVFSIGLWGELVWPLPGSYNILFFDPYVLLGIVLLGFAISVNIGRRTQYVGLLAAMTGLLSIYYGYSAYTLSLTKEPLAMFFLYVALGGTAIFTFPVTLWIDRMVLEPTLGGVPAEESTGTTSRIGNPMVSLQTKVLFGGFLLFLLFAAGSAIMALIVGGGALPSHLSSAP